MTSLYSFLDLFFCNRDYYYYYFAFKFCVMVMELYESLCFLLREQCFPNICIANKSRRTLLVHSTAIILGTSVIICTPRAGPVFQDGDPNYLQTLTSSGWHHLALFSRLIQAPFRMNFRGEVIPYTFCTRVLRAC